MPIGFIGFGNVTGAFMSGLRAEGSAPMPFYKHGARPPYRGIPGRRMEETGAFFLDLPALADACDVLLSCVVGSAAVQVAEAAAPYLTPGHLYVDLNTASPETKRTAAAIVEAGGAAYVDGAIMGAAERLRHRVPLMVSGRGAERFAALGTGLGMNISVLGSMPGQAAGIKLLRSVFQKGLAAVLLETFMAARKMGVQDLLMESISRTSDAVSFRVTADTLVSKALTNAGRMSREMEEVLKMLENEHLRHAMTASTLETYRWCASLGAQQAAGDDVPETLDEALSLVERITENF